MNKTDENDELERSEKEWEQISSTFKFINSAAKARKGQPPDTPIEFVCPICKGKAVTGYSSYNGHPYGECDCGMNFMV